MGVTTKKNQKKKPSEQSRDRATITQSISLDWEIYDLMEGQRKISGGRKPVPRSEEIVKALEFYYAYRGVLPAERVCLDPFEIDALRGAVKVLRSSKR